MTTRPKIMEESPVAFVNGSTDRSALASSNVSCRIERLDGGIILGTIVASPAAELEEIAILVGRRTVGRPQIRWTETSNVDDGVDRAGTFRFDLRFLPPDLLVKKKLKVEIKARREPVTSLAELDVETAALLPIHTIEKEQGRLEGFIDGVEGGLVRGWVWDQASAERRIKLHLFVEGIFCGIFEAASPRPDLRATGRGDGAYGFVIPVEEFFSRSSKRAPRVDLVSLEPEYWRIPLASHAVPVRRRALRVPRPRRIPETVHEFAALLASSEPFPKKVYVLDRLKQKMPDAFSADYLLLGLEFLRVEMVKTGEKTPSTWSERLLVWWRQRLIKGQISRLAALACAAAASKSALDASSPKSSARLLSGGLRERR